MKVIYKLFCVVFLSFTFFLISTTVSDAIVDPLVNSNNFYGIHILFVSELERAAKLVNSSGGDWGYVTIPIQITDRNLEKWQKFMDDCRRLHLIPILRLATEPHYKNTEYWRIPTEYDILDFANFLNSLNWPTKNRYVILFNEVNRYDEWQGKYPEPAYYADLVQYATEAFKRRSEDFFMILGGMDNAAPNDGARYINDFEYLRRMAVHNKEVFKKIDGFASHSYPNPNFAAPPSGRAMSTATYRYEYNFITSVAGSKKFVFITETGWNNTALSNDTISSYFLYTFNNIWGVDADKIVAVTPFLLESQNGMFDKFSFFKNGLQMSYSKTIEEIGKVRGEPELTDQVLFLNKQGRVLGIKEFVPRVTPVGPVKIPGGVKFFLKLMLGLHE